MASGKISIVIKDYEKDKLVKTTNEIIDIDDFFLAWKFDTLIIDNKEVPIIKDLFYILKDYIIYDNLIEKKFSKTSISYIEGLIDDYQTSGDFTMPEDEEILEKLPDIISANIIMEKDNHNDFSYKYLSKEIIPQYKRMYGVDEFFNNLKYDREINEKDILIFGNDKYSNEAILSTYTPNKTKIININEIELKMDNQEGSPIIKILREVTKQYLEEHYGIDYFNGKDNIYFGVNNGHQLNVHTNDISNPKPFVTTYKGCTLYSIFMKRNRENSSNHELSGATPMIDAMKGKEGFHYGDERTKMDVFNRIALVMRAIPETFDTVIKAASTNNLNNELFRIAQDNIKAKNFYNGVFTKKNPEEILNELNNEEWFEGSNLSKEDLIKIEKVRGILKSMVENKVPFSYRRLGAVVNRKYVPLPFAIHPEVIPDDDDINGKSILILDDVATTGKTLSDSAEILASTYAPRKISFLTIFSPVENQFRT